MIITRRGALCALASMTIAPSVQASSADAALLALEREFDALAPSAAAAARHVAETKAWLENDPEASSLRRVIFRRADPWGDPAWHRYLELERRSGYCSAVDEHRSVEARLDEVSRAIEAAAAPVTVEGMRAKMKAMAHFMDIAPHSPPGIALADAIAKGENLEKFDVGHVHASDILRQVMRSS